MRRVLTGAAVAALAAGLLTPATARAAEGDGTVITLPGAEGQWNLTLITGDTVHLTRDGSGRYTATPEATRRPDGHTPLFHSEAGPEGVFVIPDDAQPALDSGVLDRRLFDVRYLADNGYADGTADQLPLIVQYKGGDTPKATARALPASSATRSLPSIHGAALAVDKAKVDDFWSTLRDQTTTAGKTALTGGVGKVWLDAKVKADLAESVPLIGAPEAWKAGFDGTGTTVAVLDTGVDATHPDLAGKIAESRSFVPDQEVTDGHGHGTHVAATVAGSGAASGGSRKGVAPGARLVIGKVLGDSGSGSSSDIIAGMEWATTEAKAKIVSMSLGGTPTDGTDPLSQAVDYLSASTGALFVIAAGNSGPGKETIGTPGAAASALTVAATDKADQLANFSSRGPRANDGALKPDIAAPGVAIVAARAAGTALGTPVDNLYTSLNGTSMATPHVAGAAALLAQKHPGWNGERLKAALMSTAKDTGYTAYEQGAGRVDVARATSQEVVATTPNLDYGVIPVDANGAVDRTITYANDGAAEVTLTLTATMREAKDALALSASTVTVPAGGTASVTVTLHPDGLAKGGYTGAVVATGPSGALATTPVGLRRGPKKVPLLVHTVNKYGDAPLAREFWVSAAAVDVADTYGVGGRELVSDGTYRFMVEPGTYSVQSGIQHQTTDGAQGPIALLYNPEVVVPEEGIEITLDAREAVQLRFETPKPIDWRHARGTITTVRTAWDGTPLATGSMGALGQNDWYISPTKKVTKGKFLFSVRATAANAQLAVSAVAPQKYPIDARTHEFFDGGRSFDFDEDTPFPAGTHRYDLAYVGGGEHPEGDLGGKLALMTIDPSDTCVTDLERVQALKAAGAAGVVLFANRVYPGCTIPAHPKESTRPELPVAQILKDAGDKLRAQLADGPVTLEITSNPKIDYTYQLQEYEEGRVPGDLTYRYTNGKLSAVDTYYHTPKNLDHQLEAWHSWKPLEMVSFSVAFNFAAPARRTEYFSGFAADTLRKGTFGSVDGDTWMLGTTIEKAGKETRHWGTGSATPGGLVIPEVPGGKYKVMCAMCRSGDTFLPAYTFVTGNGRQGGEGGSVNTNAKLFRDGKEIPRVGGTAIPKFTLPKDEGVYRLEQSGLGTVSAWTFHSKGYDKDTTPPTTTCHPVLGTSGPCNPQPLVFVGYDLLDTQALDNTVPAGRKHTFEVDVTHPASTERMPAIAGLKLAYSTDDGQTWQDAKVRKLRTGVYTATLTYPALALTKGAVTLKAEAWDTGGNKVEQTTTRAFPLR
ncbi:S8 family serine peptidase [Microtetraspora sp. AC03309]|uniref:S8 family serine peptidase n=1 Tax=Microtetraspora sp. AC03309 TaxID=2779376 RepID=UPI001E6385B5|nr:S8 family serine peptidase [Microtetraspora sp. AC03309]MCC5575533.1 S8 family serine peptidase [Microtetraspora sp. AC03309]